MDFVSKDCVLPVLHLVVYTSQHLCSFEISYSYCSSYQPTFQYGVALLLGAVVIVCRWFDRKDVHNTTEEVLYLQPT